MNFNRLLSLLIALTLILGAFAGCAKSEPPSCRKILGAIMDAEVGLPAGKIYDMRAADGEDEYLSDALLCALYGEGGKPVARDSWIDCALFLSVTEHPCELAVFYCDSHDAAIDTARILSARLDAIKSSKNPQAYAHLFDAASVTVCGNFVLMIISSDTQNALKIAKKLI